MKKENILFSELYLAKLRKLIKIDALDLKGVLRLLSALRYSADFDSELVHNCLVHLNHKLGEARTLPDLKMLRHFKHISKQYGWFPQLRLNYF